MQVSLELDDDLVLQAHQLATDTGRTLSEVVEMALREMFDLTDEGEALRTGSR